MTVRTRHQVFAPGELPLVILALVENGPLKAYDLLAELGRLFGPDYQPSPGGVYPALTALAFERLLESSPDGRAKSYAITGAGLKALHQRLAELAAIENRTGVRLREVGGLQPVLDRFTAKVMELSGLVNPDAAEAVLIRTERELARLRRSHHAT